MKTALSNLIETNDQARGSNSCVKLKMITILSYKNYHNVRKSDLIDDISISCNIYFDKIGFHSIV